MLTLRNIDISSELLKEQGVISIESRGADESSQFYPALAQYGLSRSLELMIKRPLGSWDGTRFYPLIQLSENVYAKDAMVDNVDCSIDGKEPSLIIRVSIYDHDLVDALDLYL